MDAAKLLDAIRKAVQPLKTRITNMVARGVIKLVTDDTLLQTLQVDLGDDEVPGEDLHPDVPRYQQYGFTSVPPLDNGTAEAIVVMVSGDRSNPVVIAVDDGAYRLAGQPPGSAAMYTFEDDPDGDPEADRHYFLLLPGRKIVGMGDEIRFGKEANAKELAFLEALTQLKSIFNDWIVAPMDGGAALKALLNDWSPTGTSKTKAE